MKKLAAKGVFSLFILFGGYLLFPDSVEMWIAVSCEFMLRFRDLLAFFLNDISSRFGLPPYLPAAGVTVLTLFLFVISAFLLKRKPSKKTAGVSVKKKTKAPASKTMPVEIPSSGEKRNAAPPEPVLKKVEKVPYSREVVVNFFLDLFKAQIGVSKSAPSRIEPVEKDKIRGNRIYELGVMNEGDWVSRRITIGPLGEDGGNRSICYYVIYDDHLVVKIPPEPVTRFGDYVANIEAGGRIARLLSPKECVIPRLSVVLDKVIELPRRAYLSEEEAERKYAERLTSSPSYQKHLKIGNSFAYFMDLSRYYFLNKVVDEIHDTPNRIQREVIGHPHIIWEIHEYEGRYGKDNAYTGFEIRNVYDEFEREIKRLLVQNGITASLPVYSMRNWFLVYLSGRGRIGGDLDLSEEFLEELNQMAEECIRENIKSVEVYREVIRSFVYGQVIGKFKLELSVFVTNLVALLVWLGRRKVAIRDLKPDNLLIAGDPDRYPSFLRWADQYYLGFIDVETAVDISPENDADIEQPLLGGTPKYATPSHFFTNELILAVFKDLKRILHMQDWHASMVMIFRVITGVSLFEKTALTIYEIKKTMEIPARDGEQLLALTEYVSRLFWQSAREEFHEKTEMYRSYLDGISVSVREEDRSGLVREVISCKKSMERMIADMIQSQTVFKSEKNQGGLLKSSASSIASLRKKIQQGAVSVAEGDREDADLFLGRLERIKDGYETLMKAAIALNSTSGNVSVYSVLKIMFHVVLIAMYTEVWGDLSDPGVSIMPDGEAVSGDYTI